MGIEEAWPGFRRTGRAKWKIVISPSIDRCIVLAINYSDDTRSSSSSSGSAASVAAVSEFSFSLHLEASDMQQLPELAQESRPHV